MLTEVARRGGQQLDVYPIAKSGCGTGAQRASPPLRIGGISREQAGLGEQTLEPVLIEVRCERLGTLVLEQPADEGANEELVVADRVQPEVEPTPEIGQCVCVEALETPRSPIGRPAR